MSPIRNRIAHIDPIDPKQINLTMAPTQTKAWTVEGKSGFDDLKFHEDYPVGQIESRDVLVNFKWASLNYRDITIPQGNYPFPIIDKVVPGSDAAGVVVEVGKDVKKFKKGDEVMTQFGQTHQYGPPSLEHAQNALGGSAHGVLREYGILPETGLVKKPEGLTLQQAATLPCAALTAWNALYGLKDNEIIPGKWVLVEGTGGVSVFGLQFAKAAGCKVIATTSSDEKAKKLKELGADHVINYKNDKKWGESAKKLTPGGLGVDHVIEVAGPESLTQAYAAIKPGGVITIVGFVGGTEGGPSGLTPLMTMSICRGVLVGSVEQFEQMNAAIEASGLKPVVDEKYFDLKELKEALQYQLDQNHFGKLTIKIS